MNRGTPACDASIDSIVGQVAEDFIARLNRGEQPEIDEYVQRHPEIESTIRQVLPALQVIRASASRADQSSAPPGGDASVSGQLGDYRIVRQIGRGGMGVVYEAEQISLGRRVALKVLPFAAVLDQRQLQRFKNEAHAAAQLHHSNIVPVFSVGCERGVHYYAMQYIDGRTLAQVVTDMRRLSGQPDGDGAPSAPAQITTAWALGSLLDVREAAQTPSSDAVPLRMPEPVAEGSSGAIEALASSGSTRSPAFLRSVARLGIQAAEALDHAHESGVIHRDIKPSNLLLDGRGHLWITDFGLARLESDPGMTMTGDILGTVRYMSPEQALAKRIPIDHRTDIYSLGVTLYELLTLRPAFSGRDRQALLRQIAFNEPRQLRKVNRAIPRELETIILKAVSKNPEQRYATAQELADDLERFLEDKPIHAKRPTLVQRAAKWSKRHRAVVGAGIVLLVMAVIALSVSTALIWREQARTAAALADARQARSNEAEQRERAEANFRKAREAVDQMLTQVADKLPSLPGMPDTSGSPEVRKIKQALLEDALAYYEEFLQEQGDDPLIRYETAHAYKRVGDITASLNRYERAEAMYRSAADLLRKLADEFPDEIRYRAELGNVYCDLGDVLRTISSASGAATAAQAETAYRQAIDLHRQIARAGRAGRPYRGELAKTYRHLGYLLGGGPEAERVAHLALDAVDEWVAEFPEDSEHARLELAMIYGQLANVANGLARITEAKELYLKAIASLKALVADGYVWYREPLCGNYCQYGLLLLQEGRIQEAEEMLQHSVTGLERLVAESPHSRFLRSRLASAHESLAGLYRAMGRPQDAEEVFLSAISNLETEVAAAPQNSALHEHLLNTYLRYGDLLRAAKLFQDAEATYNRAAELLDELANEFPDELEYPPTFSGYPGLLGYRNQLGNAYCYLGRVFKKANQPASAEAAFRKALNEHEQVARTDRAGPRYRIALTQTYRCFAAAMSRLEDAERTIRQGIEAAEQLNAEFPDSRPVRIELGWSHYDLGNILRGLGRPDEAEEQYLKAIPIEEQLIAESPNEVALQLLLVASSHLAGLYKDAGRLQEAKELFHKALSAIERVPRVSMGAEGRGVCEMVRDTAFRAYDLADASGDRESLEITISLWEQVIRVQPDEALGPMYVAWLLATCPYPELYDAPRALKLAEQACELAQRQGNAVLLGDAWGTLGEARYRSGDWPGAIEALNKAVELLEGGNNHVWVFLAMAHWQLGQERLALRWYDQATNLKVSGSASFGALMHHLIVEAAELMDRVALLESAPDLAERRKGHLRVYVVIGDELVESAEATGDVQVQVEQDGSQPRVIVWTERTGEVCPYELTVRTAARSASVRDAIFAGEWDVRVFDYKTDPREDVDAWHREAEEHVAFRVNDLDLPYEMKGPSQLVTFDPRVVDAKLPADYFGTIATTTVTIPAGRWEIHTISDDGVRVWIDEALLINNWTWHAPTMDTAELTIEVARTVEIRVEHFELDGWAVLSLELRLLPPDDEMSGKAPDLSAASSEQSQERNPG